MPQVLILCAHRPKRSPSQRYRFEQYLAYLEEHGFEFTFSNLLSEGADRIFYSRGNFILKVGILFKTICIRIKDAFRFRKFDVIFIQREATFFGSSIFEKLAFTSGAYVIFDFDDSIWLADTSPGNLKWEWLKKPQKFFKNVAYAHCVMAGNKYLAEKASSINPATHIVPTTIDTDHHLPNHELRHKRTLTLGWSGSISTVKHFELLLPVLKKLKDKFGAKIRFKLLGDKNYTNSQIEVEAGEWKADTEVEEINGFDIGLMPLPDDAWTNGKCGLKGLSYMACEVPTVMSSVGVNNTIIEQGENGFLASTNEDWVKHISALIEDESLRRRIGKKGRETVINQYSVEKYKATYLSIFNHAQSPR